MSDCQEFPNTWEEFEQAYGFEDRKEIYTNGSRLIQSFRVKQWLDHTAEPERKKGKWIYDTERVMGDGRINRQFHCSVCGDQEFTLYSYCPSCGADMRTKGNENV